MKKIGIFGGILTAVCCVTPLLPFVLGSLGLGGIAALVYRDAVLFPLLAGFVVLAAVGYHRGRKNDDA